MKDLFTRLPAAKITQIQERRFGSDLAKHFRAVGVTGSERKKPDGQRFFVLIRP
jgi:hypothetical protein